MEGKKATEGEKREKAEEKGKKKGGGVTEMYRLIFIFTTL